MLELFKKIIVAFNDRVRRYIFALNCSLPQGSKLGPRLYSDYTRPLGYLLQLLNLLYHIHADDSGISKHISLATSEAPINAARVWGCGLNSIQRWTTNNRLKLNPTKRDFMVFCSSRNRSKVIINELVVGDNVIPASDCLKSLGVMVTNTLSLLNHISLTIRKCIFYLNWIRKSGRISQSMQLKP